MKKLLLTAAVIVTVMSAAFASGEESKSERATVVKTKDEVYKLFYTEKAPEDVKITLRNEEGKLIKVSKVKSTRGFVKAYNFKGAEKGTYFIELSDEFGVITKEITID